MSGNDWNRLGRDVKDIVQHAIDTGDFGALNRDLGVTLENALGNVAQSMKNAARNGMGNPGEYRYGQDERYPFGEDYFDQRDTAESNRYGNRKDNRYDSGSHYGGYGSRPYGYYRSSSYNQRMREAREEFALFINTGTSRVLGTVFTVFGSITTGVCGLLAAIFGLVSTAVHMPEMGITAMILGIIAGVSLAGTVSVNNFRKRIKRFRTYVKTLNGKTYASIKELAENVKKSEKYVCRDLQKMIKKRMFLEGHIDKKETCLIASDEAYKIYLESEKNAEEQKKKEAENPQRALSEEAEKVIEEGKRYIEEIRRSNDAIPGIEISNKMYHLENVILRIFRRVEQHPELIDDLHKFMDYYLPTTMKLLNAYEELDRQEVEGENIKAAKQEIENTLDTINIAFENLLDSFYKDTAWDVSADISVLKTMFAQEGLTGEKDFQRKE